MLASSLSLSPALSPETLRRPSSVAAGRFREGCFGAIAEFRQQANKGEPFASAKLLRHHPSAFTNCFSRFDFFFSCWLELDQART